MTQVVEIAALAVFALCAGLLLGFLRWRKARPPVPVDVRAWELRVQRFQQANQEWADRHDELLTENETLLEEVSELTDEIALLREQVETLGRRKGVDMGPVIDVSEQEELERRLM